MQGGGLNMTAVYLAIIAVVALALWNNQEAKAWIKAKKGSGSGLTDPKILIALGLAVFNAISWAMIPWFWNVLSYTWFTLIFFNVGVWTVLYLNTIKTKDTATGKDSKENDPTASKLAGLISVLLILGLITTAVMKVMQGDDTKEEYDKKVAAEKLQRKVLSKSPVIAMVASCRPAEEFDTVEEIEAAKKLYEEKGLLPWQDSIECWEKKLHKKMLPVRLAIVQAPLNNWSEQIKNPHTTQDMQLTPGPINDDWEKCEMIPNGDVSKKVACEDGMEVYPKFIQFRSNNGEIKVKVDIIPK